MTSSKHSNLVYLYVGIVVFALAIGVVGYQKLVAPGIERTQYEFAKAAVALDSLTTEIETKYGLIVGLGIKAEGVNQLADSQNGAGNNRAKREMEMIVYLNAERAKGLEANGQINQEAVKLLVTKPVEHIKASVAGVDAVHIKLRNLDQTIIENNQKLKDQIQAYKELIQKYEKSHPNTVGLSKG